jgi:glutamate N-acetyltransferase/amino-acid N-acetyltransferase
MAVNLKPPDPTALLSVPGVRLGVAQAGIRKADRHDLTVIELTPGSRVAGVFTQTAFAPRRSRCAGNTCQAGI